MKREGIESQRYCLFKVIAPAITVLILTIASVAQGGLTVRNERNQKWPTGEADKVYSSACAAVQREFGTTRELRPRVTLVLGANKNKEGLDFDQREIRLAMWDPFLFAQGVVLLAFEEAHAKNSSACCGKAGGELGRVNG